jgi:hypothetical protein
MLRSLALWTLAAGLSLGSSGCITKILTDGQIASTRRAAVSFDTVGDFNLARAASEASFGNFEGLHALAPYNTDGLYLLTKAYAGYASAFLMDDVEKAQDADDEAAEMRARKRALYFLDRAVYFGLQLVGQTADGFADARKDSKTFVDWLARNFKTKDDAAALTWTGLAWIERVDDMKADDVLGPPLIADLWVSVAMLERAAAIDPSGEHSLAQIVLASYHARSGMAEPEVSKKMFDGLLVSTGGKELTVQLNYAVTYACLKSDARLYRNLLNQVLTVADEDPKTRTNNAIAKHRAERWMAKRRAKDSCGIDLSAVAAK